MSDTVMAEEMQPEKKVAFANRKYSNEEKLKKEEEELEQLKKKLNCLSQMMTLRHGQINTQT